MSRVLGRVNDVLQAVNYIQNTVFPSYVRDNEPSSWKEIINIPKRLNLYLPDSAIDFINKEEIKIVNNPFRKYTLTSVPEDETEKRYIVFPSKKANKEFEREYAFYLGNLLSHYQIDTEEEFLENGKEFDDVLPILFDYLITKENGNILHK